MPAVSAGANCEAQPPTWKLLEGSAAKGAAGVLLQGTSCEMVVAVSHAVGWARGASGRGVSISPRPILEAGGQWAGSSEAASSAVSVQACRPLAAEGEATVP